MRVVSAWPSRGRVRPTKTALNGSVVSAARASGCPPLTVSSKREMNRLSRKNSPWDEPGVTSPESAEMQKAEPCTRVTLLPSGALTPLNVQGSPTSVREYS